MCQVHEEEIRRSLGSGSLIPILDILFHFVHFLEFSFAVPAEYLVSFPLKMIAPATYLDTFSVSHLLTHPLHFLQNVRDVKQGDCIRVVSGVRPLRLRWAALPRQGRKGHRLNSTVSIQLNQTEQADGFLSLCFGGCLCWRRHSERRHRESMENTRCAAER